MSIGKNKFGLSRYIPNEITKEIRNLYGSGCIFCGKLFIEYHHENPQFNETKKHIAQGIIPVCNECHRKIHNEIFHKEYINEFMKNPACKIKGFIYDNSINTKYANIILKIGQTNITFCGDRIATKILSHNDEPIIWIEFQKNINSPVLLNVNINLGSDYFRIVRNEIRISSINFDVQTQKNRIIANYKEEKILDMEINPNFIFIIHYLKIINDYTYVFIDKDGFKSSDSSLVSLPNVTFNNINTYFKIIHNFDDKYNLKKLSKMKTILSWTGEIGYIVNDMIINKQNKIVGYYKDNKCFNLKNEIIGTYFPSIKLILSSTVDIDGRPLFYREHNLKIPYLNKKFRYCVEENIFSSGCIGVVIGG